MQQPISLNKNVTIEFTPQQLQVILTLLKKGVFEQVVTVINTIETQVIEQIKQTEVNA